MNRRTMQHSVLFVVAAVTAWAGAGCRSITDPFMGVPEYKTVRYDSEDPTSPLKGVPRITAVEEREYNHYLRAVSTGRLVAREFRDNWVYYGVATSRVIQYPATDGVAGGQRVAVVCERYKARKPPEPAVAPRIQRGRERQSGVTTVKIGKDKDKARKELEKSLPSDGEVKVVTPEKKSGWFDWLKGD